MTAPDLAERAWLSALSRLSALDPEKASAFVDASRLRADDFANSAHADVFRAALDFLGRGSPLEVFALEAALQPSAAVRDAGGRKFLAELLLEPREVRAPQECARLIRDASTRRHALALLRDASRRVVDPELTPAEAIAASLEALQALSARSVELGTSEGDALRLAALLDDAQHGRRPLVVPTGIMAIDEVIGGLQPAHLTLVGALPGVGKSALLATVLRNIANTGTRVGLFSLEDERLWVAKRLLAIESCVPLFVLATRPLTAMQSEDVAVAQSRVWATLQNVIIDDRPAQTAAEVAATARDMVLVHGCRVLMVDHLGELQMQRSERYDLEVADALRLLRDIAKRFNVPVLVASHVRRRPGLTVRDEPQLTDFANSSAPERMARVALGLSKPDNHRLRVSVLKQTNGQSGFAVDLAMVGRAAMVDSSAVLPPVETK